MFRDIDVWRSLEMFRVGVSVVKWDFVIRCSFD
jgi:hypothetical protein